MRAQCYVAFYNVLDAFANTVLEFLVILQIILHPAFHTVVLLVNFHLSSSSSSSSSSAFVIVFVSLKILLGSAFTQALKRRCFSAFVNAIATMSVHFDVLVANDQHAHTHQFFIWFLFQLNIKSYKLCSKHPYNHVTA